MICYTFDLWRCQFFKLRPFAVSSQSHFLAVFFLLSHLLPLLSLTICYLLFDWLDLCVVALLCNCEWLWHRYWYTAESVCGLDSFHHMVETVTATVTVTAIMDGTLAMLFIIYGMSHGVYDVLHWILNRNELLKWYVCSDLLLMIHDDFGFGSKGEECCRAFSVLIWKYSLIDDLHSGRMGIHIE